eukprot:gene10365-2894_t
MEKQFKVVEVSSEDKMNPAKNLEEISSLKRWLTEEPKERASVLLKFEKTNISRMKIGKKMQEFNIQGNYNSAFIEVSVGTDENHDDFETIISKKCLRTEHDHKFEDNSTKVFTFKEFPEKVSSKEFTHMYIQLYQPYQPQCQIGLSLIDLNFIESIVPSLSDIEEEEEIEEKLEFETSIDRMKRSKLEEVKSPKKVSKSQSSQTSSQKSQSNSQPNSQSERAEKKVKDVSSSQEKKVYKFKSLTSSEDEKEKKKNEKEKKKTKKEEKRVIPDDSSDEEEKPKPKPKTKKKTKTTNKISYEDVLKNVIIVISGIQNPEKTNIRELAMEMGSKYRPDWCPEATHLICAISNTDKYTDAKKSKAFIVTKDWIYDCSKKKKKLNEKNYEFGKPKKVKTDSLVSKGKGKKDPFLTDSDEEFSLHSSDEEFIDYGEDEKGLEDLDSEAEFDPNAFESSIAEDDIIEDDVEDSLTEEISDIDERSYDKKRKYENSNENRDIKKKKIERNTQSISQSIDLGEEISPIEKTQTMDDDSYDLNDTQPIEDLKKSFDYSIGSSFEISNDDTTNNEIEKLVSSKLEKSPLNTIKEIFDLSKECIEKDDALELYDLWEYKFPVFSKIRKLFKKNYPKQKMILKLKEIQKFYENELKSIYPKEEEEKEKVVDLPDFFKDEIFLIGESVPVSMKKKLMKFIYISNKNIS